MRRSPLAGAGLALILLVGCSAELPTVPNDDAVFTQAGHQTGTHAGHRSAPPAVPIQGTCELAIEPAEPVAVGVIRQRDVGTCRIAHVGRSTLVSDKVIDLLAGTQTADVAITAANGDMLHASGSGTNRMVAHGQVAFRVELTITGGSGRFRGATGMVVSEGVADLANAQSQLTMAGTIRY